MASSTRRRAVRTRAAKHANESSADELWATLEELVRARRGALERVAHLAQTEEPDEERERGRQRYLGMVHDMLRSLDTAAKQHGRPFIAAAKRGYERTFQRPMAAEVLTSEYTDAIKEGVAVEQAVLRMLTAWLEAVGKKSRLSLEELSNGAEELATELATVISSGSAEAIRALTEQGMSAGTLRELAKAEGPVHQARALVALLENTSPASIRRAR